MINKAFKFCWLCAIVFLIACSSPERTAVSAEDQKIDSLIRLMTLEEKVGMIHASSSFTSGGVERLGIPELVMSDGPHGVRKEHGRDWTPDENADDSVSYLPVGIALAATWNPDLGYQFGKVLGSEARHRGKDVILGPGVNIIRTPLNGRNFEYMSEDPYLISSMVVNYIKGVQDQGTAACVKHYVANNQETDRNSVNVTMSERALREIYLPGFKAAVVDGGVYTVMGAYNRFRGQFCTHNSYLINDILKDEWGFKGVMMSDWGAVHNTMEALENGTDLEMGTDLGMLPNPDYNKFFLADTVINLVKSGKVDESILDDKVRRILRVLFRTRMAHESKSGEYNTPAHQQATLKIAEEAIVLLKNEDNMLPLNLEKIKSIAVIGANATRKHAGAGGSSQVNAKYEITPLEGLKRITGNRVKINYAGGYVVSKSGAADPALIREAVKAASSSEAVVFVGGWIHGYSDSWNDNAFDSEGVDKENIVLPFGQNELINAVLKANPNTVVVLMGGGAADMSSWLDRTKAVIQAWYPGMEGGNALAKIIMGEVNPSGKLPVTFPKRLEDVSAHAVGEYPGKDGNVEYKDDIFVGYRYTDTKKIDPLFCFGHGLSYTSFDFENMSSVVSGKQVAVKLTVKNTGSREGAEVVQIYVHDDSSSVTRPDKELKAFKKVFLQPGESKEIEFNLNEEAFRFFDEHSRKWIVEPGAFTILAGNSSRNIKLTTRVEL